MPKALNAPWDELKAAFVKGVTLPDLARQYGINYSALRARALRHGWRTDAAKAASAMQQSITTTLAERGGSWAHRIGTVLERHLSFLEKADPAALKLRDYEGLVRVLEVVDKMGRRTFKLDDENASPRTSINVCFSAAGHGYQPQAATMATPLPVEVEAETVVEDESAPMLGNSRSPITESPPP